MLALTTSPSHQELPLNDDGTHTSSHLSAYAWTTHLDPSWHVIYTWGDDGHELTDVDAFVVATRHDDSGHHLATYTAVHARDPYVRPATDHQPAEIVPGDHLGRVDVDTYSTTEELHEAVSGLAHAYWLRTGAGPAVLPVDVTDLPARYRRPHRVLAAA